MPADWRHLEQALAQARSARAHRRIEALLLVEAHGVSEAALRVRVDRTGVHYWVDEYLKTRDISKTRWRRWCRD